MKDLKPKKLIRKNISLYDEDIGRLEFLMKKYDMDGSEVIRQLIINQHDYEWEKNTKCDMHKYKDLELSEPLRDIINSDLNNYIRAVKYDKRNDDKKGFIKRLIKKYNITALFTKYSYQTIFTEIENMIDDTFYEIDNQVCPDCNKKMYIEGFSYDNDDEFINYKCENCGKEGSTLTDNYYRGYLE